MTDALDDSGVIVATEDDLRIAIHNAVVGCGYKYSELKAMHERSDYATIGAKRAWYAIGHLDHLVNEEDW